MYTKESCMRQVLKNERGMALAIAIVALVVVGALVAGAFFSGTQEQRVAENVRRAQASFGVAEEGVYEIINNWSNNVTTYNEMRYYAAPNPDSMNFARRTAANKTGSYNGTLYKMNDQMYLIDMTARDTMSLAGRIRGGGTSQRLGLLARIRPLQIATRAAVTSGGSNFLAGSASIDGNDHTPVNWSGCGPLDTPKPGLRMQDDASVQVSGAPKITGNPPILKDP